MAKKFKIRRLRRLVAAALSTVEYQRSDSARIRAIPDVRTIRYYTTLGLIDGPAEMKGRTAYYSIRHVAQVVAIKRLQGQGLALAEIQTRLLGLPPKQLKKIAALPKNIDDLADALPDESETPSSEIKEQAKKEQAFWKRAPTSSSARSRKPRATSNVARPVAVVRIPIAPGTTIEVTQPSDTSNIDVLSIQSAAADLIEELRRQGLLPSPLV